jgi:hypothetical protein
MNRTKIGILAIRLMALASILATCDVGAQEAYYLARNVTVTQIAPVANDINAFSVTVSSLATSTGACTQGGSGGPGITFMLSSMPGGDPGALQRVYATMLLAFSTGLPVDIASYTSSTNCASAAFVQITNPT